MAELTLPTIDALERHRVGLRGHCYRMLGSPSEADDAVQDALLKGWQKRDTFAGEERALKSWLYRIATRVCLDLIEARGRRALPWNLGPPAGLDAALIERPASEWLEPVPDALVVPEDVNPAERVILKQSVRLAFLAALQHLPGRQRAALLLTEVLDWSAAEVAECIECSVPAVNSALQRARTTIAERGPATANDPIASAEEAAIVARYVDAFERYDMDALATILREDATLQMPPYDLWLQGITTIQGWLMGRGIACRGSRLVPVAASGGPAFGQYKPEGDGFAAWSLITLDVVGGRVAGMTHFLDCPKYFPRFGLPLMLPT